MFDIRENLKKLPDKPGVYLHKNSDGEVIYVGKAVSLKNRVRQYFQSSANLAPKVRAMVSHIEEFEYITTDTEMEALILECNLIKKYMPKYNVLLRDDKTYPYIKVTLREMWPRVLKTRRIINDGARYFGPYADAGAVNQIIELLNRVYSLKRCGARRFPENFRPCLNYHIHQCRGICTGLVDREAYLTDIHRVTDFLNGKNKPMLDHLNQEMSAAAEKMEFERAAEFRDYIAAVNAISEKQTVVLSAAGDLDVVLVSRGNTGAHVIVFYIRQGKLSGRETFHLDGSEEEHKADVLAAFLKQYYSDMTLVPREILVDEELPEEERVLLEQWLSQLRGSGVRVYRPQRGDKRAFVEMARRDVLEMAKTLDERAKNRQERLSAVTQELNQFLCPDNPKPGWRLEAYDISNTNGTDSVGAMVVFEDGKPMRKDYRRFKIKTIEGPNDYGSLQEVMYRRMKRALAQDPGFSKLPDLLLMDGGKTQVSVVEQVLSAMQIDIMVAGMVKDDHHRTRGLVYKNQELDLKKQPVLFRYLGTIQEEVHRFAIEYHRGLRGKALKKSVLDEIDGVGEKRKAALFSHFGSIEAIQAADVDDLCRIPGMTRPVAEKIKKQLHNSFVK